MKLLSAAALLLMAVPFSALADDGYRMYPESVTGTVRVDVVTCIRAPCPPMVAVVDAAGVETAVIGTLRDDLAAFAGKTVTLNGVAGAAGFEPKAFAPGVTSTFLNAVVEDKSSCMGGNGPCITRVLLHAGNETFEVSDPAEASMLRAFDGASVIVRGKATAAGYRGSTPPTFDLKSPAVYVKGTLKKLPFGMNGQTHTLSFPNGDSVLVTSSSPWENRDGAPVWLRGTLGQEMISGLPMLRATWASGVVYDNTSDPLLPAPVDAVSGTNVTRDEATVCTNTVGYGDGGEPATSGGGATR